MARISFLSLFLLFLQSCASSMRLEKRDAPFESVRTRLGRTRSGVRGDPPGKYFHESVVRPYCRYVLSLFQPANAQPSSTHITMAVSPTALSRTTCAGRIWLLLCKHTLRL
jgi:hypothetical protein